MRHFLFLQGPHGPFFAQIGAQLHSLGHKVWRVGFNAGDAVFWPDRSSYIPYQGTPDEWHSTLSHIIDEKKITDIALYGDVRSIHAQAILEAKKRDLRVHIFEEGYLRPWWVTYERNGSNGNSDLMEISLDVMSKALTFSSPNMPEPPAHWGEMRQHIFYGAYYHWFVLMANTRYKNFKRHRELSVFSEALLYSRRLLSMPLVAFDRERVTRKILKQAKPFHLVMLQLEHDTSFQFHSPFSRMEEFIVLVLDGFAKGSAPEDQLVFKAHPLETGRFNYAKMIQKRAKDLGVSDRVHYVRGGKLGQLLDQAKTAITVNSTAGQQALWRGIPVRIFGNAIYDKSEFVSRQKIEDFFQNPHPVNRKDYTIFRDFLLQTSQIPGGYYSARGRRQLERLIPALMLRAASPYDARLAQDE